MKKRMNLLYAVLAVVIVQLLVVVLLFEGLSYTPNSLGAVEASQQQQAAPLDVLPGKRAPRTILESEGKLRLALGSATPHSRHQIPAANEVITTPTAKAAATSVSKQGKPLSAASSAAIRARLLGRSTNKTKKFVLETATVAKPIVSSVPLRGPGTVSERPNYDEKQQEEQLKPPSMLQDKNQREEQLSMLQDKNQREEQLSMQQKHREERLKPPSMLRDSLGLDKLMEIDEEKVARDMIRREQERRSEILKREQEEKEERRRRGMEEMKRQEELRSMKAKQQQKMAAIKYNDAESPQEKRAQREQLIKNYIEAHKDEAKKLDKLWREKKSGRTSHIGGNPNTSRLPSPKEYFNEVCAQTQEPLVECQNTSLRKLTEFEASGRDIMFTMRTTMKYHDVRLPVLFDTWLSEIEPSSMFIVTDGEDEDLLWKTNTLGTARLQKFCNTKPEVQNHN